MPTRDPETGKFVAGEASSTLDYYSDLEVQVLQYRGVWQGGADAGTDSTFTIEYPEEDVAGGLDNDELAELVGFRRTVNTSIHRGSGAQSAPAEAIIEASFGANLSGDEHPIGVAAEEQVLTDSERDIDDSGALDIRANVGSTMEPGVFDVHVANPAIGWSDATNGTGGGTDTDLETVSVNYRNLAGHGPVLDANDGLSRSEYWSMEGIGESLTLEAKYLLFWNVEEMEERRPAFGL